MKTAAIIGISSYARHHLLIALEQALHGRLRLVAATVVNQDEEAFFCARLRSLGCEIFAGTEAMWACWQGRIDLCFIPTGIHLHAPMTLQALAAGSCVLVEKPLAATVAEAHAIIAEEQRTGRFVAVGFQDLYTDSTWDIKQQLLEGIIGEVEAITIVGLWPRPTHYYSRNDWAGRLRHEHRWVRDSPINNAFAHFLNLALFWSGPAPAISAQVENVEAELYRIQPIESFDTCCIRARLTGGTELRVHATHSCREDRVPRLIISGSAGSIAWAQESHYEITHARGQRSRHAVPAKFETKLMMADAVLARFDNPCARICSSAMALEHLRLVEAVHQTAAITDLPVDRIRRLVTPSGEWRTIEGIEEIIDEASRQGTLWSEAGAPWARPSARCRRSIEVMHPTALPVPAASPQPAAES